MNDTTPALADTDKLRPRDLARDHQEWIQVAAKIGWATKGGLYLTLGSLALLAAFGSGGQVAGGDGVIQWLARQSFGAVLLAFAGIGFSCYALWRVVQVVVDPEYHSSQKVMVAKRVGWSMSAVVHVGLAIASFQAIGGGGGGDQKRVWLSSVMHESWGPALIAVLGLFVLGVGLDQLKQAVKLEFLHDVETRQMSQRERNAIRLAGRFGLTARGVVFPIVGYYLIQAAMSANPGAAKGVGGALHEVARSGWFMLALIAAGLAAYGVLQLFFAKYRRLSVP